MSSPNPFNIPASDSPHTPPFQNGGNTPRYGTIPPLSLVVYHRGRSKFQLNPYSWQHAFLTGHYGTPTVFLSPELSTPGLDHGLTEVPCPIQSHQVSIQVVPHLLTSPADVPDSTALRSLSRAQVSEEPDEVPNIASNSPNVETPVADSVVTKPTNRSIGWKDEAGNAETTLYEAVATLEQTRHAQPFPLSPLHGSETTSVPSAEYVAQPAELNHRRFSPYNLRKRDHAVMHQVREQAQAAAIPFDNFILRRAGIKMFNPAILTSSDIDLLYDCGSSTGRGITIAQFGKIFKRCMDCDHYVFRPRSNKGHDCNGPAVDVKGDDFRLTEYFFIDHYLGLTEDDFKSILGVCDTCLRVHLVQWSEWHKCPPGHDLDFVE